MVDNQSPNIFSIKNIDPESRYLESIKKLADENDATLGFLPYGAFDRLASQQRVLGCISTQDECVGYLVFEIRKNRVKILHLCISAHFRSQGIPGQLLSYLKKTTADLYGISVSCRRDYNLNGFWSALGFVAKGERPGKAKEGSILTEWWLDYGKPDLFSFLAEQQSERKLCVVIDANVFFDLTNDQCIDDGSRESQALLADWLSSETEFFVTNEIFNEIDRNTDEKLRKKLTQAVSFFSILPDSDRFSEIEKSIKHLFPITMKQSDKSDLRQIARAIATSIDASFFITRDSRLLEEVEEEVYRKFGLRLVSPIEFIVQQDQLRRDDAYQPARLAGTSIKRSRISADQTDKVIHAFLANELSEKKPGFRSKIKLALSDPLHFESILIVNSDDEYLALVIIDRSSPLEFKVPILRFKSGRLSSTLIRHFIFDFRVMSANEKRNFICISDQHLSSSVTEALQEDNFINQQGNWLRVSLSMGGTLNKVAESLKSINFSGNQNESFFSGIANTLSQGGFTEKSSILNLEKTLFPVRFLDADVPIFIIPIKAKWAKELFDPEIANEYLWGAQEDLALNREGVYYRSKKKTCRLEAPGRILWYVSEPTTRKSAVVVHAIRAISFLDEIIVDVPKVLYKQFRRLGVYTFQDVLAAADDNLAKEIMAIKFSETQLLNNPVKICRIREILGNNTSLPGPIRINAQAFSMIYNEGI
jgi:predicted nucleic acid-binding protein/ribosomal protein S18 acetylase RimI-like enzyme